MPVSPRRAPRRAVVSFLSMVALACTGTGSTGKGSDGAAFRSTAAIDSIAADALKGGNAAGLSIGVMRGGDTIALKGFGKADLELDIATPPHAVYEIGSVTKQFTAVAILQLRDSGKLALTDDIRKHLPDYPTQGNTVTVRQLLDHTSGIKGYTELPAFGAMATRQLPKDSLVALFAREKFTFTPGAAMVYNNSAYFLAGLIIEKLSGMSYEAYVQKHFFDRLGMKDSHYCSESRVIKGKVKGYDMAPDTTLVNKGYMVHTYPFSAGSLCSSAHDLLAWNRALHNGGVLSPASYNDLIAPTTLNDGTRTRYGLGLSLRTVAGHRLIEHGGGIPGFLTASHYYPDDSLAVVVVINTAGPVAPDAIAVSIARNILGARDPERATFTGDLARFTGTWAGIGRGQDMKVEIKAQGQALTMQLPGSSKVDTLTFGGDSWWRGEDRLVFTPADGQPSTLRLDQTYGVMYLSRKP